MLALISRELRSYYCTLGTWILLAAHQFILAWLMLSQVDAYRQIQPQLVSQGATPGVMDLIVVPTLSTAMMLQLLIVPLMGMRGFAAELESGRIALLLSAPIGPLRLATGKWLGLSLAVLPFTALTLITIVMLEIGTALDFGRLFTGAIGLLALSALAAAVTLWYSSLTRQPAAAAAASTGTLLLLWILGTSGETERITDLIALSTHLQPLLQGLLQTRDLFYFVLLGGAALLLTAQRLATLGGR